MEEKENGEEEKENGEEETSRAWCLENREGKVHLPAPAPRGSPWPAGRGVVLIAQRGGELLGTPRKPGTSFSSYCRALQGCAWPS